MVELGIDDNRLLIETELSVRPFLVRHPVEATQIGLAIVAAAPRPVPGNASWVPRDDSKSSSGSLSMWSSLSSRNRINRSISSRLFHDPAGSRQAVCRGRNSHS